jgi:hypothetical protein
VVGIRKCFVRRMEVSSEKVEKFIECNLKCSSHSRL